MAAAVNCFVTDPMSNTVSTVKGVRVFRSASPYAFSSTTSPFTATRATPEKPRSSSVRRYASTRSPAGVRTIDRAGPAASTPAAAAAITIVTAPIANGRLIAFTPSLEEELHGQLHRPRSTHLIQ